MIQFTFFSAIILLAVTLFYFAWFRGQKMQQRYIEQVNNWPEGFPFKRLNLRIYRWAGWIWLMRISTSLFLLFAICISGLFLSLSLVN
ncbi:MAG: hypothetical protein DWQ07_16940 [Chloroflexi bacterium]|nr:MAG: hypothetical protein DWQ07_16940 [Chloroflexota bacterium]MBL1195091.1 hypothetical protein [Chloroflexota bacterium]